MSEERVKNAARATFTAYMDSHNMRKTHERYVILEKVLEMSSHFFIDTLYASLDESGYHVSRSTVYNTMELLLDAKLVRKHQYGNRRTKYERVAEPSNYYHLICTSCGKVREIKDSEIDALLSRRFFRFHPHYADLSIYGECSRCAKISMKKNQY